MVAGMCDMPFLSFAAVSLLAAAGWSLAYLLPGWATGAAIRLPLPEGFAASRDCRGQHCRDGRPHSTNSLAPTAARRLDQQHEPVDPGVC